MPATESTGQPQTRTDGTHEATSQILQRLGRRIRHLHVAAHGDGFVLNGRVSSFYVKQLAQQAVMEMGGLVLTNAIEVE